MSTQNPALAVIERARSQPDAAAFVIGGRAVSYSRTVDLMVHFAQRMKALGISRDSTVGLATNDMATAAIAGLAVALLGGRWTAMSSNAAAVYPGITHLLATVAVASLPGAIEIDRSWVEAPFLQLAVPDFPGHAGPDDMWMIASSSGTTGKPKFMPITYGALWRRIENPDLQDGLPPTTLMLFAATSYVGMRINIGNLVMGGTNVAGAPWQALMRAGVNRVVGSPAQVSSSIFDSIEPQTQRIRSLKVTGAKITARFVETALQYFGEVQILYGATEVGVATLARLTHPSHFDGSAGQPFDGVRVEVVDHQLVRLPVGTEGIVRLRSEWMVPGYLDEPALTAAVFKDGWFYPGDLGTVTADGALHIAGRANDVLNAGGTKFNGAELDEVIQLHPAVADGFCFVSSSEQGLDVVGAIVTLRPGSSREALRSLGTMAAASLGRAKSPRRVFVVEELPRNENGKPLRVRAAQLCANLSPLELAAG
jgi:acyl-coenzyme A synthetase/AMP-(fatty) acid ligase